LVTEDNEVEDVDVAILDSGINDHPAINLHSVAFTADTGSTWTPESDVKNHGTRVAGIVGAYDSVGVAPGVTFWNVKVVDDNGEAETHHIIAGLEWVLEQPEIDIINMSLGAYFLDNGDSCFKASIDACLDAGIPIVTGAGNIAVDIHGGGGYDGFVPAAYDDVTTVSGVSPDNDQFYSGFGYCDHPDGIKLAAPFGVKTIKNNGVDYDTLGGTSSAAPHVTGMIAIYFHLMDGNATDGNIVEHTNRTQIQTLNSILVFKGQPQTEWSSYPSTLDPDSQKEPMVFTEQEGHLMWLRPSTHADTLVRS
jgi:subtilisin family serine protease